MDLPPRHQAPPELRATANRTELTLLDILEERGKAARDGAGWHMCLASLGAALDGEENAREAMGAWRDAHAHYVEDFGREAASTGPPEGFE